MRPTTNCNFLLLNRKIVANEMSADTKNSIGIIFKSIDSFVNNSKAKTVSFKVTHKLNTKIKPPETTEASNKYMVCIL